MKPVGPHIQAMVRDTYAAMYWLTNVGDLDTGDVSVTASFISNGDPPGRYVTLTARQGEAECVFPAARLDDADYEEFDAAWKRFVLAQPVMSRVFLDSMVRRSRWANYAQTVRMVLVNKGFRLRGAS